jgi:hypothetical protein
LFIKFVIHLVYAYIKIGRSNITTLKKGAIRNLKRVSKFETNSKTFLSFVQKRFRSRNYARWPILKRLPHMQPPHTHLCPIIFMLNASFLPEILYIYTYSLNSKLNRYSGKSIRGVAAQKTLINKNKISSFFFDCLYNGYCFMNFI